MTPAQYNGILAALASAPGFILPYGGAAAPTGWVLCDGSAINRTTYAALFAIIGTSFGVGDGVTTFNVPDMRSRFPVGSGTGTGLSAYVLGASGGAESRTIAQANLPALSLAVAVDQQPVVTGGQTSVAGSEQAGVAGSVAGAVSLGGSATALPTLPPYLAVNYVIKT